MADISIIRHQEIFNPNACNPPITIVGCGAIGSRIFMSLIELGCTNITCIDFDRVEPHNLANQAFEYQHIGMFKVHALESLYTIKTNCTPPRTMRFHNARLPSTNIDPEGVVFLAVDSFAARKEIVDSLKIGNVDQVIDVRMASSYGNVYCFAPGLTSHTRWLDTLGNDDEAEVSTCGTSISVGPTASIIANLAVWQFINFCTDAAAQDQVVNIFLKPFTAKARSTI